MKNSVAATGFTVKRLQSDDQRGGQPEYDLLHKLSQANTLHVINRILKSMPNLTGGLLLASC